MILNFVWGTSFLKIMKEVMINIFHDQSSLDFQDTKKVNLRGNSALLLDKRQEILAIFCSDMAPASILLQLQDLANHWRYHGPIIMSGFQSIGENEVLSVLLRGPQPIIICMAREIEKMRIKPTWKIPFEENRLLLVSPFGENVKRSTAKTACKRNLAAARLADKVLIAHAQLGSKTEKLAKEILKWEKPIFTLKNKFNKNLEDIGIVIFEEL